jgi:hypothetical protein
MGMRGMIDLHEVVKSRKMALEEIRKKVNNGDQVVSLSEVISAAFIAHQLQLLLPARCCWNV